MAQVLLIGDDRERTRGVKDLLALDGHRVEVARDLARWRENERALAPDLVVAALAEPAQLLNAATPASRGFAPPILFVHSESDPEEAAHLDERLIDRIVSPFAAEDLLARVDALVRVRRVVLHSKRADTAEDDEAPVQGFRGTLASWLRSRVPRLQKPVSPYLEVAARVAEWSDRRDGFEPGHAERVTQFSALIAEQLDLPDGETASLLRAAMLHDIGKVALPIDVLRQKSPLADNQMRLVRTHAERGAAIVRALDRDDDAAETILLHHEHVDGSGYHGRKGNEISRPARVLAVAEGYDAMTTSLVRNRMTPDAARETMRNLRGTQWDGDCVNALIHAMKPKRTTIALA